MEANIKVGDYVRTTDGIDRVKSYKSRDEIENGHTIWFEGRDYGLMFTDDELYDYDPYVENLIQCGDLLYVDIDNGYEGGIIVPRIAETLEELERFKDIIKKGHWILKGIVTHEQLHEIEFKL